MLAFAALKGKAIAIQFSIPCNHDITRDETVPKPIIDKVKIMTNPRLLQKSFFRLCLTIIEIIF